MTFENRFYGENGDKRQSVQLIERNCEVKVMVNDWKLLFLEAGSPWD